MRALSLVGALSTFLSVGSVSAQTIGFEFGTIEAYKAEVLRVLGTRLTVDDLKMIERLPADSGSFMTGPYTISLPSGRKLLSVKAAKVHQKIAELSETKNRRLIQYNAKLYRPPSWPTDVTDVTFTGFCYSPTRGYLTFWTRAQDRGYGSYNYWWELWKGMKAPDSYDKIGGYAGQDYKNQDILEQYCDKKDTFDEWLWYPANEKKRAMSMNAWGAVTPDRPLTWTIADDTDGDSMKPEIMAGLAFFMDWIKNEAKTQGDVMQYFEVDQPLQSVDQNVVPGSSLNGGTGTSPGSAPMTPDTTLTDEKYTGRCNSVDGLNLFEKALFKAFQSCEDWATKFNNLRSTMTAKQPFGYASWFDFENSGGAFEGNGILYICVPGEIEGHKMPCIDVANSEAAKWWQRLGVRGILLTMWWLLAVATFFRMALQ